uniref:ABC transporter ATP-binding protein n=1 Tax=Schlesneria paludicola TaxID=360056 RepID=A0A7C2JZJ9_9PLAN
MTTPDDTAALDDAALDEVLVASGLLRTDAKPRPAAPLPASNEFVAHEPASARLAKHAHPEPKLAVRVDNLWIRYGKFVAVKGISLAIPHGEVFGFIGPNGAGKSSTIRVLATLQAQYDGRVLIDGLDVRSDCDAVREKIGYVPDFFGVYEDLTVREYLHFFAAAYRLPWAKRPGTVDDVLQLTDLTHKIDFPVDSLSRGMKQRLSLARVLLHDPAVLLLDEPASGLDPRARIEMRELLKALKEMGKTIVISSHILHELAQLCTQIGIIEAGRIVAQGSVAEIYRHLGLLRIVHVQLANRPEELLEKVRGLPGVTRVDEAADRWSIRCEEDALAVEDLHAFLVEHGARLRMFQPEVMDMETAFMKLTEGQTQ